MIEFVTLFLGLVSGPHLVVVDVADTVAAVEVSLDGQNVGRIEGPPWQIMVDFGPDLVPRELVVVAEDQRSNPLDSARQLINVPRPPAEASLVLERDDRGHPVAVRLRWESSVSAQPLEVTATLDGSALDVEDPRRIDLGRLDSDELHFVQAELKFSPEVSAWAQLAFGGEQVDEASSELTALPVIRGWRGRAPDAREMGGWFSSGGGAVDVAAVEEGLADLVIVAGPGVSNEVSHLAEGSNALSPGSGNASLGPIQYSAQAGPEEQLRRALAFDQNDRIRLVLPRARESAGHSLAMEQLAVSPEISPRQGGLLWLLRQDVVLPGLSNQVRVADAVAVAGLQAAAGGRRRGVLLVLAGPWDDFSRYQVGTVVRLLEYLQVPLVVWQLGDGGGAAANGWAATASLDSRSEMRKAFRRLESDLDKQRVVWLRGAYLPQAVAIAKGARATRVVPR